MGAYYGLWFGGWIRLMYVDVGYRFYLSSFHTLGMEVLYQTVLTPTSSLGEPSNPIYISDDEDGEQQLPEHVEKQFYRILEKELSVCDVTCDMLVCLQLCNMISVCIYIYLFSE